jgi:hypothetical protein
MNQPNVGNDKKCANIKIRIGLNLTSNDNDKWINSLRYEQDILSLLFCGMTIFQYT